MRLRFQRFGHLRQRPARRKYDAFISYSHAADGRLAPALQKGLQRFAKPWYRARALRIFRDEAALSANPRLWSSIQEALDASEHYILLASPQAAVSEWVSREAARWRETKPIERLLIGLTDGELVWSDTAGDFDWRRKNALPMTLRGAFGEEPRYIDLRWARDADDLSLSHPRFRDAIAELAAPLHGKPKDELASEEVRQHRRTIRIAFAAVLALAVLTAASIAGGVLALTARNAARRQLNVADSRALAGQARADYGSQQLDRGLLLGLEAYSIAPTAEARASLVQGLGAAGNVVRFQRVPPSARYGSLSAASLAFTPDGRTLAVGTTTGTILRFAVTSGRRAGGPFRNSQGVASLAYSPDGKLLAVGSCSGSVVELNAADGSRLGQTFHWSPGCIGQALTFGTGGKTLIAADGTASVARWEVATGRRLAALSGQNSDIFAEGAAISPDGREVATGGRQLTVWDAASGRRIGHPLRSVAAGGPLVTSAAFAPSGNVVAAGTFVGTVLRWNPSSGRKLGVPLGGFVDPTAVTVSLVLSPDGKLLAAGDSSGTVTLFDLAQNRLAQLTAASPLARSASQSCPSGARAAARVVGCASSACAVSCVYAVSQNSRLAAVGNVAGDVELWNIETRQRVAHLAVARTASGYRTIDALAFSPDRNTLAAAAGFGAAGATVTLWDVPTRTELGPPLAVPSGRIRALRFSPDGHSVTGFGDRGTVTWQPLPLGRNLGPVRARICDLVGRNLSLAEWHQFIPSRSYRRTCPQWP